jgi:hypothetical protein
MAEKLAGSLSWGGGSIHHNALSGVVFSVFKQHNWTRSGYSRKIKILAVNP